MKWPEIFPSADLLKQIEGVESGLRTRRRPGRIGSIVALAGVSLQIIVSLHNNRWFTELSNFVLQLPVIQSVSKWLAEHLHIPPTLLFFLPLFIIVPAGVVFAWSRYWLKESQEPFRYTFSIGEFKPVRPEAGDKEEPSWLPHDLKEKLLLLSHDLAHRLIQRVGRLRFRDESNQRVGKTSGSKPQAGSAYESHRDESNQRAGKTNGSKPQACSAYESHIHVRGFYVIRRDRAGDWSIEVMPRVRIGSPDASESLAHPVVYKLGADAFSDLKTKEAHPNILDKRNYERILERLYFSAATEIYQQIRRDVEGKIDLLPSAYFRAVALFHEAEDYAKSNTLDAYREAGKLYWRAAELFDPCLKRLPDSRWRRFVIRTIWRPHVRTLQWAKAVGAHLWLRFARVQLMCARAEIGYANMLLYRRILGPLSGERLSPVFEPRPIAENALARLERLPPDAPSKRESLFDAYVTTASAFDAVGSKTQAHKLLEKCSATQPAARRR
jgi:hypothetical protein